MIAVLKILASFLMGAFTGLPTRSFTTRFANGVPRPVTRSYPGPAEYFGEPVLVPLVIS